MREADPRLAPALRWLAAQGREPLPFQREAWQAFLAGGSGLIQAPTGTGKTLAAWLGPVLEALEGGQSGSSSAASGPKLLWVTPLRALANDLIVQLREPLAPLGLKWRVEARTGDTSASVRQRQRRDPPAVLVTTPETLSVFLSHAETHAQLSSVRTVVVDEWHELLGSKRGSLLELSLAHLRALAPGLRTWGVSATLPNLQEALGALLGPKAARTAHLIRGEVPKEISIEAALPRDLRRFPWAGHLGTALIGDVTAAIDGARSALVFVNTRSQAEFWFQEILRARPDWVTATALHHGSIDRKIRTRIEEGLRAGSLRCVVCTSSLDLGVDFAPVERVIQIGSPKAVARLLQRAGRSGHRPGERSRILCVPTHALELIEIAAVRRAASAGRIEARHPLPQPLDVLVQHAVTLAAGPGFEADELLAEVQSTQAFAELSPLAWRWVIDFITRGGAALQGYPQFRRVAYHQGRFRVVDPALVRRHRLSIGTITSDGSMRVKWLSGGDLGAIDESFVTRLAPRSDFIFAGRVLELVRIRDMTVYVRASRARRFDVPRWSGTRLPISDELADAVLEVLALDPRSATDPELRAVQPLLELQARWSGIPARERLIVESLHSREGHHLFVYPFRGRLANEGLAMLMALRLSAATPTSITVTANDYGFELLCASDLPEDVNDLRRLLHRAELTADLLRGIDSTESARRRFRDIARIAGLVLPGFPGRSKSSAALQASSGLVYDVLRRYDPQNLLLDQARTEVLEAELDQRRIGAALERIASMQFELYRPPRLTPFAFPLWAARLQTQMISSESWQTRIEKAAARLEREAGYADRGAA